MNRIFIVLSFILLGCQTNQKQEQKPENPLATEVVNETLRSWNAYKTYAWGHDELKPLSKSYNDWYREPLYISLIDAYSTLKIMGLEKEASEIEHFVADSLSFDKDMEVKTFEVIIRILGGLLSIYDLSGNEAILAKAQDFGNRMMPAFQSPTGLPYYWVNLKTRAVSGDIINVAEASSNLIEMGVLSYYTQNPIYYQAAKKATRTIFENRSSIGLIAQDISVTTGKWTNNESHIGACTDSYFEYLYKGYLLFGDPELKQMWDQTLPPIQKYLAVETDTSLWFGRVNQQTGVFTSSEVTLWDAYFPGLLALSGNLESAKKSQLSWHKLWCKNGIEPMVYDFKTDEILNFKYHLNPEIMESAYYLFYFTADSLYYRMGETYFSDLKKYCRTELAFTHLKNVVTKEQDDQMSTFFFAETLKYLYLTFSNQKNINPEAVVFSTEAHPFIRSHFTAEKLKSGLNIK